MSENERIIRTLYQVAEEKNFTAFAELFGDNGVFVDMSTGTTFRGQVSQVRKAATRIRTTRARPVDRTAIWLIERLRSPVLA